MKNFLKTVWNVLKYLLVHFGLQIVYIFGISFVIGIKIGLEGGADNLDNFDAEFASTMSAHIPISLIFAGVGSLLIYKWMVNRKGDSFLEVCRFNKLSLDKSVVSFIAGMSLLYLSSVIVGFFPDEAIDSHVENMSSLTEGGVLLFFLAAGIMAPLIEEVIFRGLIFKELRGKVSIFAVILIQALLFGFYHLNLVQGAYTFVMGVFLGISLLWTGSIWAPILIHAGNNIFSIGLSVMPFGHFFEQSAVALIGLFIVLPVSVWYLYKNRMPFADNYGKPNLKG
ncbi:CPBP family intramembrane glutamic endopeptidase [Proteinivorax hydrogeniformans]|uniref:CPBP family intramembrane glutamic endopeptidase n=1 Tax=Proteinivorax hydrogeniformans TaxID=1826727 RepID=A0AAU8HRY1_9FIRM